MPNLISKSIIYLLTNVKYGIFEQFSWDRSFKNLGDNEKVFLFNETIKKYSFKLYSTWNYHDDRDPTWNNNRVKKLINEKNDTFQCYLDSNKDPKLFNKVEYLQKELKSLMEAYKENYYLHLSKRMMNPLTSTKIYWSISISQQ